ncbi:hypothetical protein VT06_07290 [Arsukibacterium sp. MJ3]|uniref:sugar-transfer associated ATP-grasp domain-containing protein n=1 Tax=Arsukibacterium sp. MJ3 TaxID=1632859 RepID=UPI000626F238|nr:sugar-transfer associated ATP-grasp domain-containing protein [Arsukibacterium sp. MJ3]KKO49309.1 hypothetical protein VT06_07290 [Arsukibacterium sp. MJ3]
MLEFTDQLTKTLKWKLMLIQFAHQASLSSKTNRYSGYFSRLFQYYQLYREHGFLPDEVIKLNLLDHQGNISDSYVSKSYMTSRQQVLNPPSFQVITEDKALFYSYCMHMNIPVPKLLGFFFKNAPGVQWGKHALAGKAEWADFFENHCPEEFVIKASLGVYGDGIYFVDKTLKFSGEKLFNTLNSHPKFNSFVVQHCLKNHPGIMQINPKRGLQTFRVITYIDSKNNVKIIRAYFKPIVGSNRVDNHKSGLTGNLLCSIDLSTGKLKQPILLTSDGPVHISQHPDTGAVLEGALVPLWDEMSEIAKATALKFLPLRSIGWDIAVTTDGIQIIEGNSRWDPLKFGDFGKNNSIFID